MGGGERGDSGGIDRGVADLLLHDGPVRSVVASISSIRKRGGETVCCGQATAFFRAEREGSVIPQSGINKWKEKNLLSFRCTFSSPS